MAVEDLDKGDVEAIEKLDKKSNRTKKVYMMTSYRLFEEVNNGIQFFGKARMEAKVETAEFICHCGESFRSTLSPIANGKTKHCGCGNTYTKK